MCRAPRKRVMNASFTGRRSLSGGTFGRRPANPKTSELRQRTDECLDIRVHTCTHTCNCLAFSNMTDSSCSLALLTTATRAAQPNTFILYVYIYVCVLCVYIYRRTSVTFGSRGREVSGNGTETQQHANVTVAANPPGKH